MKKKVTCIVLYGLLAAACCVFLVFTIINMYSQCLFLITIKGGEKQLYDYRMKWIIYDSFLCITFLLIIFTLIWQIIIRCANLDFFIRKSLEKIKKRRAERKEKSLIKKFERTQKKYEELEKEINKKEIDS